MVVTWNILLCANSSILQAFTLTYQMFCCILRIWGLFVQVLDMKLDFVGQCVLGVEIQ